MRLASPSKTSCEQPIWSGSASAVAAPGCSLIAGEGQADAGVICGPVGIAPRQRHSDGAKAISFEFRLTDFGSGSFASFGDCPLWGRTGHAFRKSQYSECASNNVGYRNMSWRVDVLRTTTPLTKVQIIA